MRVLVLLLMLAGCQATVPSIERIQDTEYRITGKLDKAEYDEIIDIVQHHPGQVLRFYVDSNGGTSADLFEAMEAVHAHGQVHWYSLKHCDSACAVMALSTRHAHGEFRLHSFYKHHRHHIEPAPDFNEKILDRLGAYGYDKNRLNHMFHSVEELWPFYMKDAVMVEE